MRSENIYIALAPRSRDNSCSIAGARFKLLRYTDVTRDIGTTRKKPTVEKTFETVE